MSGKYDELQARFYFGVTRLKEFKGYKTTRIWEFSF